MTHACKQVKHKTGSLYKLRLRQELKSHSFMKSQGNFNYFAKIRLICEKISNP